MKPGIETEVVYDKAESGLYHYENIGKTGGAYTSLSNALLDANSEDAAAWDAEKDKTKKRLIAGATVAGVGAVGGFVGDKLVDKHFDKLENEETAVLEDEKIDDKNFDTKKFQQFLADNPVAKQQILSTVGQVMGGVGAKSAATPSKETGDGE
ncbi:MAG: hypothetical protein K5912_03885, partial [Alphaproteobacteria bacterium]|nr:hypothetical protein [Alphaproteobacteria bacterium]